MPKGDSKGQTKGKRAQQLRKKGRRTEESDDEEWETQSVASRPSTGTHSGEEGLLTLDGVDEGVEEEVEDNFEQILAENIDGACGKSSRERHSSLLAVQKALRSRIISDFVSERRETILDCIEKCVKRGSKDDRLLASSIAVLLCVQLGVGTDSEFVFKTLKPHFVTLVQDETLPSDVRESCATALALCCFIASEDSGELIECSRALETIFDSKKTVKAGEVGLYSTTLLAWALLLSVTPPQQAYTLIRKYLRRMMNLLETSDLKVKTAAGGVVAMMYEIGRDIDKGFVGDNNGLCDLLRELSRDGAKHKAKKELRQQRSSFRDILSTVEDGTIPEELVRFGGEYIELDSWVRRRQYSAFKEALGTGITVHLQENDLLRQIFELGPQIKATEMHKVSRYQRQLYNNAVAKARTLTRGKNRDKRNASIC